MSKKKQTWGEWATEKVSSVYNSIPEINLIKGVGAVEQVKQVEQVEQDVEKNSQIKGMWKKILLCYIKTNIIL